MRSCLLQRGERRAAQRHHKGWRGHVSCSRRSHPDRPPPALPPVCAPGWQRPSCCPQPSEPCSWKRTTTKSIRENRAPDQVGEHCFQLLRDESELQVPGTRSSLVRNLKRPTGSVMILSSFLIGHLASGPRFSWKETGRSSPQPFKSQRLLPPSPQICTSALLRLVPSEYNFCPGF